MHTHTDTGLLGPTNELPEVAERKVNTERVSCISIAEGKLKMKLRKQSQDGF